MKRKLKRGQLIYFWYSASEVCSLKFKHWVRLRNSENKIALGAHGTFMGSYTLTTQPHTDLYFTYDGARSQRGWKVKRPYPNRIPRRRKPRETWQNVINASYRVKRYR